MVSVFAPIAPGLKVMHDGRTFVVDRPVGVNWLVAYDVETGEEARLRADQVHLPPVTRPDEPETDKVEDDADDGADRDEVTELAQFSDDDWAIATWRRSVIAPLLDDPEGRTKADVIEAGRRAGVSHDSVYRWLRAFEGSGETSSLVPRRRGRRKGHRTIARTAEDIVWLMINEVYLTRDKRSFSELYEAIGRECAAAGIALPARNTVRNRIASVPEVERVRRREGSKKARGKFSPVRGRARAYRATAPMESVQIDHTLADVILVEDTTRKAMGRPTVTLAICEYTRMLVGLYISMSKPDALAVGICLTRSMLPKGDYMTSVGVAHGDWPVYGRIGTVKADNAREFRGKMLERACDQHGIATKFRRVKVPEDGPHIERLMGTLADRCKRLDGKTFSSVLERGEYDSDGRAVMTLGEFEAYIVDFFVNQYNTAPHSGIDMAPIDRWRQSTGLLGDDDRMGGVVEMVVDPDRLVRDFLPYSDCTVQRYGVSVNGIHYYNDDLGKRILERDPANSTRGRKFTVRYDPRDVTKVWFFDPDIQDYLELPCEDLGAAPTNLLAFKAAKKINAAQGAPTDPASVFATAERQRRRLEESARRTKETKADRRALHLGAASRTIARHGPTSPVERAPTAPPPARLIVPARFLEDRLSDNIDDIPDYT